MIGKVIGTYKIVAKLGEGGMGAVYKGVDTMLDREVAIKALRPELASQTAIVERFRSEAVTLAKLNHPNIATLYSLFRQGDELYMVLEYVRGETLDEILARRGALPTEEVIPVFCQILDGINHAHDYGIIHRDIKPANMMLTEAGILKVLDFGIARLLGTNRMTRAGNIIGTLEYMAPEQVKGHDTDARSDTYALGMMLYEVLTGRTPFNTENEFELMKLQTESLPPPPRSIFPSIPAAVEDAIMRSIQKDPDERFQSAGDFREFLLEAGYVDFGALRKTTGPKRAIPSRPSYPPVSASQVPSQPSDQESVIKETRLGAPSISPSYVPEVKETRLGEMPSAYTVPPTGETSEPSLFDRLTWVHYAGAGSIVVGIVVFLMIIPIVIFNGVFSTGTAADANTATSQANENSNSTPATPVPSAEAIKLSTPAPTPERILSPPDATPPVDESSPVSPEDTPRPVEKTRPAQPVKKPPPPVKKTPAKSGDKKLREARCALTGDC